MVDLNPDNYERVGQSGMQGFRSPAGAAEALDPTGTKRYSVNARVNAAKHDNRVRRPERAGGGS